MTFTQAVRSVLTNYVTFSGRARRSEYCWFYLFTILVSIATAVIDAVLSTAVDNEIGIVGLVASLALLLPSLAVTARRLHDTGRTGWWMLLPVVPLLAAMVVGFAAFLTFVFSSDAGGSPVAAVTVLLVACVLITLAAFFTLVVFLCLDSSPGPNKYGPSPKQPIQPTGTGGYHPYAGWYTPQPPPPGYGQPYGYSQQPPAPPAQDYRPPHA
jgi:uncharacterized membrane protein YhaH (DUF805 family)